MLQQKGPVSGNGTERENQSLLFGRVCELLSAIYHQQFHQKLETLKAGYLPYNPDRDTRILPTSDEPNLDFPKLLGELLTKANFRQISEHDLNAALSEESLFKIRLFVDFNDFKECLLFARGVSERKESIETWFGFGKREITFTNYDRVVLYLEFNEDVDFDSTKMLPPRGTKILKLFRNVPKADLEMLFPNTQIRMKLSDKFLIGFPAIISGGVVLTTKLGGTLLLIGSLFGFWLGFSSQPVVLDQAAVLGLLAGFGALGGYLWKQFSNFKNRKLLFLKTLTENLYFKNLDNNAGVFHRLIDDAEEEECKEAILAYAFLQSEQAPMSAAELDNQVETWFSENWQCALDFEIEDALGKLIVLGLVKFENGEYTALKPDAAIEALKFKWQGFFTT